MGHRPGMGVLLSALLAVVLATPASASGSHFDVTISSAPTQNMTLSGGIYSATADNAVLNVADLASALGGGSIEVTTGDGSGGDQKGDLSIEAGLSWGASTSLMLDAYHSLIIDDAIADAGMGGLTLANNDGGAGGSFTYGTNGSITISSLTNSLTINGAAYTLVNSVSGLAHAVNANPTGLYALAASYDAGGDGAYSKPPVAATFKGAFDGLGNTISHLTIATSTAKNVGLFSKTQNATLAHIGLVAASVSSSTRKAKDMGALVGTSQNTAVDQAYVSGTVSSLSEVYIGGLLGSTAGDTISRSHSTANVTISGGDSSVLGGLIGFSGSGDTITLCFATGNITGGSRTAIGGLVGETFGTLSQSYATGNVKGGKSSSVGGLLAGNSGTVLNVYATGSATSPYNAGGLIGVINTTAGQAYSTGVVSAGATHAGGSIGFDNGQPSHLTDLYWDTTTSGITNLSQGAGNIANDPGITGQTTAQLQSSLPTGFDPAIWAESPSINSGLPYLIANPPH